MNKFEMDDIQTEDSNLKKIYNVMILTTRYVKEVN